MAPITHTIPIDTLTHASTSYPMPNNPPSPQSGPSPPLSPQIAPSPPPSPFHLNFPSPPPPLPPTHRSRKPNPKYFNENLINHTSIHPIPHTLEPSTHNQALKDPKWRSAMDF